MVKNMRGIKIRWILCFIIAALTINTILFLLFTLNGFNYIYKAGVILNIKEINTEYKNDIDYSYFNYDIKKNKIFILKNNIKIDETQKLFDKSEFLINFLSYVNANKDVYYIIDDVSFSAGCILNLYINSGDRSMLDAVFFENKDDAKIKYYEKLYEYNNNLQENKRLTLYGINSETRGSVYATYYIDYLLNKVEHKIKPAAIFDKLFASRDDLYKYFNDIRLSIDKNELLYKELFVEDYFYFNLIINNYFTINYNEEQKIQTQALNFIKIYQKNNKGKYFGIFNDSSFIDIAYVLYGNIEDRVNIIDIINDNWFENKKGKIYAVNNNKLEYIKKHQKYLYSLYNSETNDLNDKLSGVYFLIND